MPIILRGKKSVTDILFIVVIVFIVGGVSFFQVNKKLNNKNKIKEHALLLGKNLSESESILLNAVYEDDSKKLERLLCEHESIIKESFVEKRYYSVLHYAVNLQSYKATETLLKAGYNPNVQDMNGITPLYLAVDINPFYFLSKKYPVGETKFVNLLLDYNASPDICDDELISPLMCSLKTLVDEHNFPIQKLLIEKGNCNINHLDKDKKSILFYVRQTEMKELESYLLSKMAVD